jgi:hypothetical protein
VGGKFAGAAKAGVQPVWFQPWSNSFADGGRRDSRLLLGFLLYFFSGMSPAPRVKTPVLGQLAAKILRL